MATATRQMYRYTNEEVARVCFEANRALQNVNRDQLPSAPWDAESEEIRASAVAGVMAARQGIMPRESHDRWIKTRAEQGWAYGPVKDPERKTHPNMVRYEDLPEAEQIKDRLFIAIVTALTCEVLQVWRPGWTEIPWAYHNGLKEDRFPDHVAVSPAHASDRAGRCLV